MTNIKIRSTILVQEISSYSLKTKLRELILPAYIRGDIDLESALSRLQVSRRQFYRLKGRYLECGVVSHQLINKPSNHRISDELKAKIIELYKSKYTGWNYEHIHDSLEWRDGIKVSSDTIRNILLDSGLTKAKQRKGRKYERRQPKARFNELVQLDGTFGDFLGDGRLLCLMHMVDDATKTSMAILTESECTQTALQLLYKWCLKYGLPASIYTDRHSTYKVNDNQRLTIEEELEGLTLRLSDFGKVCDRLGIKQIYAYSPQAKGRVERKHNLYKDRWTKELKLDGIATLDEANAYLEDGFIERLNTKFTIKALEDNTPVVLPSREYLLEQFTIQHTRTVRNDYTVQLNKVVYQLSKNALVKPRAKVIVKQYLDGSIGIFSSTHKLGYQQIEDYVRPVIEKAVTKVTNPTKKKPMSFKDHPYRQQYQQERKSKRTSCPKQLESLGQYYG